MPLTAPQKISRSSEAGFSFSLMELLYEHKIRTAISKMPMPSHCCSRIFSSNSRLLSSSGISIPNVRNTSISM